MKASERLRLEASLGNNVYQPWPMVALREAADLLDECERALLNWKEAFNTGRNEPLVIAKEVAENTLAKLRAAQEKAD